MCIASVRNGQTFAVSAPHEDGSARGVGGNQADNSAFDAGAVYVSTRSAVGWVQQAYLKASNIRANDTFGVRLALSADGNVLAAGAPLQPGGGTGVNPPVEDDASPESGAAYVFTRDAGHWRQDGYLKALNAAGTIRDAGLVYPFTRAEVR